jgi:hypothetical protein
MRVYDGCHSLCAWHSLHRPKLDVHGVFIHLTPTLTTTLRDALLGPARTCARSSHHHPDAWCRSSELVRRLNRYSYANLRCVVVKHSIDDRFAERNAETEYLSTHDNVNVMKAERVRLLGDASHLLDAADVIGIDGKSLRCATRTHPWQHHRRFSSASASLARLSRSRHIPHSTCHMPRALPPLSRTARVRSETHGVPPYYDTSRRSIRQRGSSLKTWCRFASMLRGWAKWWLWRRSTGTSFAQGFPLSSN